MKLRIGRGMGNMMRRRIGAGGAWLMGLALGLTLEPAGTQEVDGEIVTVRAPQAIEAKQRLPYFVGISGETAGAKGLSMNLVIIPPGGEARAHYHRGYESAIYLLTGRVETRYGPGLEKSVVNEAGDFIFIPPDVPHQPRNLSPTEPAMAIVARNDPNEQEHVISYEGGTEDQ